MVQDIRSPYLLQEREGVIFQQPPPPQGTFQIVQTPYNEVVLLEVAGLKILVLCPQNKTQNTLPRLKNIKTVVIINTKFLTEFFPPEIGIWPCCLKVILMLLLFP